MSKIIDITDKLNFEENPKIKIKNVELEINASAENVLKVMGLADSPSISDVAEMCNILFVPESKEKLDELKLNFADYKTVVSAAIAAASGSEDEESGE